jgi:hypothetical protein
LAGKSYDGYTETLEVCHHDAEHVEGAVNFTYVDNPPLDPQSIIHIGGVHQYDILVFLFKDCDSFTKLYNFLTEVREVVGKCEDNHIRYYWGHLKKIFLVFTDF